MVDSTRLRAQQSGRTEVIRDERGCVVAKQTVGDGGITWINFSSADDTPLVDTSSEERRALPLR